VTFDEAIAPVEHSYDDKAELERRGESRFAKGESHGMSVFFRIDDAIYHTYSAFARGTAGIASALGMLDITPFGRAGGFRGFAGGVAAATDVRLKRKTAASIQKIHPTHRSSFWARG
jgi:hypothetical protein